MRTSEEGAHDDQSAKLTAPTTIQPKHLRGRIPLTFPHARGDGRAGSCGTPALPIVRATFGRGGVGGFLGNRLDATAPGRTGQGDLDERLRVARTNSPGSSSVDAGRFGRVIDAVERFRSDAT